MKKISIILLIIFMICVVSCEKQSSDTDYKYMYAEGNSVHRLTASEDGYYFINGLYLYFCDFETMEAIVLCNKPNCLHDKELDETKKYNCNGFLITGGASRLLTTYDNYLYCYIEFDLLKDIWQPEIIRISLDGSERKTVSTLEKNITTMALHRGKLYYATSVSSDQEQDIKKGIYNYSIKEFDIFKNNAEPIEVISGKENMAVIHNITPVGDKIKYTKYVLEDDLFTGKEFIYDINNKSIKKMAEDINLNDVGPVTISDGNYIFTPISINGGNIEHNEYIYKNNIETGVSEKLFKREFTDIKHYSDDKNIYVDNILSFKYDEDKYADFIRTLTVYDMTGNKVDSIDINGIEQYSNFISGDDKYMFVKGEDEDGAYIKYIDKSKIGTGSAKLETLFKLERKYLDESVRRIKE